MARQTSTHEYPRQPMVAINCPCIRNLTKLACGAPAEAVGGIVTVHEYRAQDGYRQVKRRRYRCKDRHEFYAQWTEMVSAATALP